MGWQRRVLSLAGLLGMMLLLAAASLAAPRLLRDVASSASSSLLALTRNSHLPDPSHFHHGLLGQEQLTVDTERSYIVATTGQAGVLGFLGHKHGVLATGWQASVRYDPAAPERSSIEIVVSALDLVIDTESARRRGRLKMEGPNETEIPEIQTRMLGPDVLDTGRYPILEFRSERVQARGDNRLRVHGQLTLLGVSRAVEVDVWVRKIQQFRLFSGRFEIKQRDFGIDPISMGGVVKVADKVSIRIEMWTLLPQ